VEERPSNARSGDDDVIAAQLASEEIVWVGRPSQVSHLGLYFLCILFFWLVIPIFIALVRWLQTRANTYEITTQRIRETTGIFSKQTDDLELYRVKDMRLEQPFFLRMFNAGHIVLLTSDRTSENYVLRSVRPDGGPRKLMDTIRRCVETRRDQKRVREIDMEPMDQT
jgi:uncharacterized membrane protein YdbT with pleckstrin-like domain